MSMIVLRKGAVAPGDTIRQAQANDEGLTVLDIVNLYTSYAPCQELLRRAAALPALRDARKRNLGKQLLRTGG